VCVIFIVLKKQTQLYIKQAVIQSPFSNGGSPTPEAQDTRFTYFPAVSGTGVEASQSEVVSAAGLGQVTTAGKCTTILLPDSPQVKLLLLKLVSCRLWFKVCKCLIL
jgi:hypothetical protein